LRHNSKIARTGCGEWLHALGHSLQQDWLRDKPEELDQTFNTLITHLRTRYSFSFTSTNKKRDGTVRQLKTDLADGVEKSQGKLVVKARRSYVAPKN
jgi:hypothetical protein